uniref:rhodanese-like domain-containing protein n=1 Tax=Ornithobacterium rhinotracheale TaxID=28251 RepID=UPI001629F5F2|nr:rhodanese-like domain-containing protein [Ornithobacterium rhinotracheale]
MNTGSKNIVFALFSLIFSMLGFQSCKTQNTTENSENLELNATEFNQKISEKPGLILDVRTQEEYAQGHLEQAQLLNYKSADFTEKAKDLPKNQPIYVYCRSGRRSHAAAEILRDLGYHPVFELEGGIIGWQQANLPTKTEPAE